MIDPAAQTTCYKCQSGWCQEHSVNDFTTKAKKIWESLPGFDEINAEDGIDIIASAIEAERKAGIDEGYNLTPDIKDSYQEGYRRGLEEAAKVVTGLDHCDMNGHSCTKDIADRIRQHDKKQ